MAIIENLLTIFCSKGTKRSTRDYEFLPSRIVPFQVRRTTCNEKESKYQWKEKEVQQTIFGWSASGKHQIQLNTPQSLRYRC